MPAELQERHHDSRYLRLCATGIDTKSLFMNEPVASVADMIYRIEYFSLDLKMIAQYSQARRELVCFAQSGDVPKLVDVVFELSYSRHQHKTEDIIAQR